jgi:spore maturation protein CgeB
MIPNQTSPKMIYVGSLANSPDRDSGWIREFEDLGWKVSKLDTNIKLNGGDLLRKIKRRLQRTSEYIALEQALIALADTEKPLWVHFRLPTEFSKNTILQLKKRNIVVTQYCNDDAFSTKSPFGLYSKFRKALPVFDGHFVFRHRNIRDYLAGGAQHVEHCPPTFDPVAHNLDQRAKDGAFIADVAFVGHYENDGRLAYMEGLQRAGFNLILKGGMWDSAVKNGPLAKLSPIPHAFGDEYNRIYANAIAGLCFFSKINNDEWTRRGPEIIAVGGLLVCERTSEAQQRFKDREEAFFFSSVDELVEIVGFLIKNPQEREKVRAAGYARLMSGGYTLTDRARQISQFVSEKCQKNA